MCGDRMLPGEKVKAWRSLKEGLYAMKRILPSMRIRQGIEELLQGCEVAGHYLDNFIRLSSSLYVAGSFGGRVEDFMGRVNYRRGTWDGIIDGAMAIRGDR